MNTNTNTNKSKSSPLTKSDIKKIISKIAEDGYEQISMYENTYRFERKLYLKGDCDKILNWIEEIINEYNSHHQNRCYILDMDFKVVYGMKDVWEIAIVLHDEIPEPEFDDYYDGDDKNLIIAQFIDPSEIPQQPVQKPKRFMILNHK